MDKATRDKAVEWSLSSIVGNLVWIAVSTFLAGLIGSFTGSFQAVCDFASTNAPSAAAWSLSFLAVGAVAGALTGARIAIKRERRKMDEELAEKQAVIDRLMNRREYARMTFRGLSYAELEKVREVSRAKRTPFMSLSDAAVVGLIKSGVLEIADDSTYAPPDCYQVRLKESFRALTVEFSDVLDEVIGEIEAMDK